MEFADEKIYSKKVVIVIGPTGGGKSIFFKFLRYFQYNLDLNSLLLRIRADQNELEYIKTTDSAFQTQNSSFDTFEFQ